MFVKENKHNGDSEVKPVLLDDDTERYSWSIIKSL